VWTGPSILAQELSSGWLSSDLSARWEQSHSDLAEMSSLETWISENLVVVRNMAEWIQDCHQG